MSSSSVFWSPVPPRSEGGTFFCSWVPEADLSARTEILTIFAAKEMIAVKFSHWHPFP